MTEKNKNSVRCRFRILAGDLIALGPGKVDLLESIDRVGSISQAARESRLSYRRAWNMVDTMNRCFAKPLVASVTGGKGGGGAKLTPTGKKAIQIYRRMGKKADTATLTEWKTLQKLLHHQQAPTSARDGADDGGDDDGRGDDDGDDDGGKKIIARRVRQR